MSKTHDPTIHTIGDLYNVLGRIKFRHGVLHLDTLDLRFGVEELRDPLARFDGWRVQLTFMREDTVTGEMGRGTGRWELLEKGATLSSVVKTAWVLFELLVKHELMEAFTFDGVAIFDPHRTVAELSLPAHMEEIMARGEGLPPARG